MIKVDRLTGIIERLEVDSVSDSSLMRILVDYNVLEEASDKGFVQIGEEQERMYLDVTKWGPSSFEPTSPIPSTTRPKGLLSRLLGR